MGHIGVACGGFYHTMYTSMTLHYLYNKHINHVVYN